MARDRELTPRQRWVERQKEKLLYYIFAFTAGAVFFYFLVSFFLVPFLIPKNAPVVFGNKRTTVGEVLEYAERLEQKAFRSGDFKEKTRLEETAERIKDAVFRNYPFPTLTSLLNNKAYPYAKTRFWLLWIVGLTFCFAPWFYFFRKGRGEWRAFFMREALREPPIKYGKARDFIKWEEIGIDRSKAVKTLFGDEKTYREVLAFFSANIVADNLIYTPEQFKKKKAKLEKKGLKVVVFNPREISKAIGEEVKNMYIWARDMGIIPAEKEEHFKMVVAFVLFHYVSGLYGNIPAGFLVTRIKDYTLKRVISVYHMRKRIITKFKNREVKEDEFPSAVLDAIHTYRPGGISVFERLSARFNPLPFTLFSEEASA